jgi:DNA-binding winged helix-turn-helix (wHTH) protein
LVYRFGDFTLDHDLRQLFLFFGGSKEEIHLSPKAFELLTVLLENRSRAVSKAELQQSLWPSTFVEESNIAGLILELRRALRDSASHPSFIRTVYGFGYRFIGDVAVAPAASDSGRAGARAFLELAGRQIVLTDGANIIGREPDVAIQIDLPGISRRHACIVVSGDAATIEDLGSKNGTQVSGSRITAPTQLADGDVIRLGAVSLTFRIGSPSGPTETVADDGT